MRVAIYARVSTDDKGQDPENQLRQLREWCANAGHTITGEFIETASGGKGERHRPEFARLMLDAHKRQFDLVLCWALDRFTREGMRPTHRLPPAAGRQRGRLSQLHRTAALGIGDIKHKHWEFAQNNYLLQEYNRQASVIDDRG